MKPEPVEVARRIVEHYRAHKRELPWRRRADGYAVWVSEVMLQQTRVATVIPYYERWLERFPTVELLASAPLDDVMSAWSGLGYYKRARNLHRGAAEVVAHYRGQVPGDAATLRELPGIGRYMAGAISSIAYGQREPAVDGNAMRVLARIYAIETSIRAAATQRQMWDLALEMVPATGPGDFNQGVMDLGATICTPKSPDCASCPLSGLCLARARGRQDQLPLIPARKSARELPLVSRVAVWVARRGKVLLMRRNPEGLFGGLWELPQAECVADLDETIGLSPTLLSREPVYHHRQRLTHRRLSIRVWRARLGPGRVVPDGRRYSGFRWQEIASLERHGLAAATRRIATELEPARPGSRSKPC